MIGFLLKDKYDGECVLSHPVLLARNFSGNLNMVVYFIIVFRMLNVLGKIKLELEKSGSEQANE